MTSTSSTPDTPLAEDIHCMHCNYNLRTRRPSDICPECGESVAESMRLHEIGAAIIREPGKVAKGFTALAVAFSVQTASALVILQYPRVLRSFPLMTANFGLMLAGMAVMWAAALWILYLQRRSPASTAALRGFVGWSCAAQAIAGALYYGSILLALSTGIQLGFSAWEHRIMRSIEGTTYALFCAALMVFLLQLANRLGARGLWWISFVVLLGLSIVKFLQMGEMLFINILEEHPTAPWNMGWLMTADDILSVAELALYAGAAVLGFLYARRIVTICRK